MGTHFDDITEHYNHSDEEKTIYLYNVNRDFDKKFKYLIKEEKQMLFFHAVSYLYHIKTMLCWKHKDLLLFLMSSFYSRRELFNNVIKYGLQNILQIMKIRHLL